MKKMTKELMEVVKKKFDKLPDKEKLIFTLRFLHELQPYIQKLKELGDAGTK